MANQIKFPNPDIRGIEREGLEQYLRSEESLQDIQDRLDGLKELGLDTRVLQDKLDWIKKVGKVLKKKKV